MKAVAHGTEALGARLRELRLSRGLTLRELATKLEISPSSLSMLENGKCGVALRRLQRLADFYGVTISKLMASSRSGSQPKQGIVRFSRVHAPDDFVERGKGVWYRVLDVAGSSLQPFALRLEPRAGFVRDALAHPGEEFVFVVKGTVELHVGRRSILLAEGDAAYFDSSVPHAYRNRSDHLAIVVGAATPPW